MLHKAKRHVSTAIRKTYLVIKDFERRMGEGHFPNEEAQTPQFIEAISEGLRIKTDDVSVDTHLFVLDKYKEEPIMGADVLIVNAFQSPNLEVSHGMLAQAKILKNGYSMGENREMKRLKGQCCDMLQHTKAAYVWLYDGPESAHTTTSRRKKGTGPAHFRSLRASLIINLESNYPDKVHTTALHHNLFHFLMGNIGDSDINLKDQDRLMKIIANLGVKYIMLVHFASNPELDPTMDGQKELEDRLKEEEFSFRKLPEDPTLDANDTPSPY